MPQQNKTANRNSIRNPLRSGIRSAGDGGMVAGLPNKSELVAYIKSTTPDITGLTITGTFPEITLTITTDCALVGIGQFADAGSYYLPNYARNTDNQVFWSDNGIAIYSSSQTDKISKKILKYLKEDFWPDGLVLAVNVFDDADSRGEELQTSYAGDQYLDGVNIGLNPAISDKGLAIFPDITNIFESEPTAPITETLTAQDYCLQCYDGSVSCSYGTATPDSPLQFTATAGDVTFTPTDCSWWDLKADGGYIFPMLPTGVTQSSSAATSSGNGASILMDDAVLGALRGEPDGVELVNTAAIERSTFEYYVFTSDVGSMYGESIGDNFAIAGFVLSGGVAGDTVNIRFNTVLDGSGIPVLQERSVLEGAPSLIDNSLATGEYNFVYTLTFDAPTLTFTYNNWVSGSIDVSDFSVQKLNPATCTVMSSVYMGVGSDELLGDDTLHNELTCKDGNTTDLIMFQGDSTDEDSSNIVKSYDGITYSSVSSSWDRDEILNKFIQARNGYYRTGYQRFESDGETEITGKIWSSDSDDETEWTVFDDSFNPTDYLRVGFSNTLPLYLRKLYIWQSGDIIETRLDSPLEVLA